MSKKHEILEAIEDYAAKNNYLPTVREIGELTGLKSSSTVHHYMNVLEKEGFIERDKTKPRAFTITKGLSGSICKFVKPVCNECETTLEGRWFDDKHVVGLCVNCFSAEVVEVIERPEGY